MYDCSIQGLGWCASDVTHLVAIGGNASELCQLDLGTPVGTVPHKGNVASAPLLIDVALVECLSIL